MKKLNIIFLANHRYLRYPFVVSDLTDHDKVAKILELIDQANSYCGDLLTYAVEDSQVARIVGNNRQVKKMKTLLQEK